VAIPASEAAEERGVVKKLFVLAMFGCGSSTGGVPVDAGAGSDVSLPIFDAAGSAGSADAMRHCSGAAGPFPRNIDFFEAGDDGVFDPSLATDPATGRIWMSFSGTHVANGEVLVSTYLGYSDDHGASFCDTGIPINFAIAEPHPPAGITAAASWNHEVSRLFHDPADGKWKIVWHRYLLANTGTGEDRQFQYGWIGLKVADSPEQLVNAAEQKLFAGKLYAADTATQAYNDAILGPPQVRVDALSPATANCLVISEPGVLATASGTYVSLLCGDGNVADNRIIILGERGGTWGYNGAVLTHADAQALTPNFDGFSGSDLFTASGTSHILASPTAQNSYFGCIGYKIDLDTATIQGQPEFYDFADPTMFTGACAYDEDATVSGLLYGVATPGATPAFKLYASGMNPY
jgi:hypothetical protein